MWPFRKKKKNIVKKSMETLVTGLIIGGAVGSIIGKKLVEQEEENSLKDAQENEEEID